MALVGIKYVSQDAWWSQPFNICRKYVTNIMGRHFQKRRMCTITFCICICRTSTKTVLNGQCVEVFMLRVWCSYKWLRPLRDNSLLLCHWLMAVWQSLLGWLIQELKAVSQSFDNVFVQLVFVAFVVIGLRVVDFQCGSACVRFGIISSVFLVGCYQPPELVFHNDTKWPICVAYRWTP